MSYRLIASDIDGTLCMENHISPYTRQVFQALQKQGIELVLCSGRSYPDAASLFEKDEEGMHMILLNGALRVDAQGTLQHQIPLQANALQALFTCLCKEQISFGCYDAEALYAFDQANSPSFTEGFQNSFQDELFFPQIIQVTSTSELPQEILKIEIIWKDASKRAWLKEMLSAIEGVYVTTSGWDNLEITDASVSKGNALSAYLKKQHIHKEEVLVFGDSENDVSLFQQFPHSIAVKNACDAIKQLAWKQCESVEQEGVAAFLAQEVL